MGLGILEDRVMEHVPGTTRYFDDPERPQYAANGAYGSLKCDTSGPLPIILVPQPSDDPNDPLNWPLWKRDLITFILSLTAIFATSLGPILAANTLTLTFDFSIPFTGVAELTGWYLLGVGVAAFIVVPSGRIWGKRHMFVAGTILLVATSAWGGASRHKRTSMIVSRVFQGVATAPFESLVNAAVGDLYCVHQRGIRMAFTNLAVFGGAFFTPIVVGKITNSIGWWWTFYLVAIFCAACLPLIFFFCPETAYRRETALNLDLLDTDANPMADVVPNDIDANPMADVVPNDIATANTNTDVEKSGASTGETSVAAAKEQARRGDSSEVNGTARRPVPAKMTYAQSLALFNGRKTDESFWKLLLRPFPLFLQPAFLWACLIQGLLIGWTVFIGVILAQFFLSTPLWWGEVKTGYAYTAAFVGAIIGFAIAGALSDWSAKLMTKWNGGVYEPEFRIVLVIPQMVLGCAGLYGWGRTVDGLLMETYHYAVPLTFFALEVAGMVIGAVASSLYIVDAYRDLAIEGFTCMIIFKNLFSFGLTLRGFDWLVQTHTKATPLFNIIASVQLVVCLLSIPMYVFGKRIRSFFHRHDLLEICKVR
ncbi:major facilitator superfamily domain-containing protein [Staphylotrichum tortipilum]|uniref:Major facilitator superfamily domain-containing protein n=1 Tax=Staphylotrichum tortipilum TaxID=2831512 RepID=A0AAN6MG84_9PEZI|nr:major facilitator superfamily domain-containing protein [Staphylotrichum longicolle]